MTGETIVLIVVYVVSAIAALAALYWVVRAAIVSALREHTVSAVWGVRVVSDEQLRSTRESQRSDTGS